MRVEPGDFLAHVAAVGEERDFLGDALVGGIEFEAGVAQPLGEQLALADRAAGRLGGDFSGEGNKRVEAGDEVGLEVLALAGAHRGELGERVG